MTVEDVFDQINMRARAFRDDQIRALREGDAPRAYDHKIRAMVLEQLLADLVLEQHRDPS